MEEACRIMGARVTATSKCREKTKEPILAEKPEEIPPPYVPFYQSLPPAPCSKPHLQHWMGKLEGQSHL
jgi:hypothetical protein